MTARSSAAWIDGLASAVLALHLATNGLYDFHRDSLYYIDSARHPAWGYVDYPPVTPTIARFSLWVFGPSVWGLRLWPSLAGALIVVLAAVIARELGGGRFAQVLAAVAAAASPVLLGANWLFQTVTFDQLIWVLCFWIAARLSRTAEPRLWLGLGIALGVGLETKYTIVALVVGFAAGAVLTRERRHLRTPWPWFGLVLLEAHEHPERAGDRGGYRPRLSGHAVRGLPDRRDDHELVRPAQRGVRSADLSLPRSRQAPR